MTSFENFLKVAVGFPIHYIKPPHEKNLFKQIDSGCVWPKQTLGKTFCCHTHNYLNKLLQR